MMSEAKLPSSGLIPCKTESSSSCPTVTVEDSDDNKSSSTEGPDSPDHSSSASPIPPSMIPPSPHHSSSASSSSDFQPLFSVTFTDHITKNGDTIKYRPNVTRIRDSEIITMDREYEDFQFLHHGITSAHGIIQGIVFPPLPPRPATDPHSAEARAKLQIGSGNRILRGDDFRRDCRLFEKYFYMMLSHPTLGATEALKDFLESPQPPIRAKIKRGLFSSMLHNLDYRKSMGGPPDLDEAFQKERDMLAKYSANMKKTRDTYHELINCRLRLTNQLSNLASINRLSIGGENRSVGVNGELNRLNSKLSTYHTEEATQIESLVGSEDNTLGVYLDLYSNYSDSVNDMLLKRTSLMTEFDNASKALAKAKLSKIGSAKVAKDTLEARYNECSKLAAVELKRFHQRRIVEMKEAILCYTEGQFKAAKEASGGLARTIEDFKRSSLGPEESPLAKDGGESVGEVIDLLS
uniref:Sorting nexin-6-like n=1 Tax=Caligus rogercresseyi TaxID=217165 RepID=C1BQQ0_CALRO|nr:Sorting nexin-6-like [Caligus rogercresseyi]